MAELFQCLHSKELRAVARGWPSPPPRAWESPVVQIRETTPPGLRPAVPGRSSSRETQIVAQSRSYANGCPMFGSGRLGFGLFLGIFLLAHVRRIRINLAWRWVLGEVELFLDLALTAGQFPVTLLALEMRTDFGFQFFRPLDRVDVSVFVSSAAFPPNMRSQSHKRGERRCM